MIQVIAGDVTKAKENIIGHQVNCKGVMGSGVALDLRNKYPAIFEPYKNNCAAYGNSLLGKVQVLTMGDNKLIANMFGQDAYGTDKQYTEIDKLEACFFKLYKYAIEHNFSIAMPYGIGCGRGGADWNVVYPLLEKYFSVPGSRIQLTLYKKEV